MMPIYFFPNHCKVKRFSCEKPYMKRLNLQPKKLPEGYFFKIYSAYRSISEQTELWNKNYTLIKEKRPNADEYKLTRITKAVCADPRKSFGGHQTEDTIDIALCNRYGQDYDMGTVFYLDHSEKIKMQAKNISKKAKGNRDILYKALQSEDFVNYPNEWWHFCYGDRMWAAYKKKNSYFYGAINKQL